MSSLRATSLAMFIATGVTVTYGHLPNVSDASLQMGRTGSTEVSRNSRAAVSYSNKGEWNPEEVYRGDYEIATGDTVSFGTFNGKKLWWWAKFYAAGDEFEPGNFAPQGGTSPWVLINSLSAVETGTVNYKWRGLNGDMETMSGLSAEIPTWRDGAVGAYSFTHDDIGAMPFDISVKPGWDLAKDYPEIKQCWGVYTEKMSSNDWKNAREMVLDGHEMFNHSMEHTSAADQWQWFKPGQVVPSHDPAIPEELRGLTVVGTWGDPAAAPACPVKGDLTRIFESPLVAIRATHYWTQNAPSSEAPGTELKDKGILLTTVIEPEIYAKDGVEVITLATGQKQYVKYGGTDNGGTNEGYIAATGATWLELSDLDKYGGQYWKPSSPAMIGEAPTYTSGQGLNVGDIVLHGGSYYKCLEKNPYMVPDFDGGEWNPNTQWEPTTYDANNPQFSTEGEYVGPAWSSSTQYVAADKGAPSYVAKVFCVEAWLPEEYKLNIQDASDLINENLYEQIVTAGEYFRKGKRVEYYGYPFDAYSEVTHDSLESNGFVGARGGAKSGRPIPGDFFHPYRIDFDAFYVTREDWKYDSKGEGFTYPDNPHVLLGLNEMVDEIIDAKGYMIREFHAVADIADGEWYSSEASENWPLNSAAQGAGGWWGGITVNQLKAHYDYVQAKIIANEITVYTVGEVTKYRITANATSDATIVADGDNYTLTPSTNEDIPEKYRDEITVMVSLDAPVDSLNVIYKSVDENWGASPRRRPRKMDGAGKLWSVSINPFLGAVTIEPNAEWGGQDGEVGIETTNPNNVTNIDAYFNGIQNGKISLNLPAGNYTAELFNSQGRMVGRSDVQSTNGVVKTGLSTANIASGIYYLNVTSQNVRIMPAAKIMIQ